MPYSLTMNKKKVESRSSIGDLVSPVPTTNAPRYNCIVL